MVPFILYELSNGFLNFLHRAFKESHANLIILGDVTHTLRSIFGVVRKCERPPSPGSGNQISTDTPIKAMLFKSIESSNSSMPPYQFQHTNYTTNFTFCQPIFLICCPSLFQPTIWHMVMGMRYIDAPITTAERNRHTVSCDFQPI